MSTHTDRSAWSPEEVDSLENIDKELQLVSTSSESHSVSNHTQENGSFNGTKTGSVGQSSKTFIDGKLNKLHSSCDDLPVWTQEKNENDLGMTRSNTFANIKQSKKSIGHKYDHVQSKIKQYFHSTKGPTDMTPPKPVIPEIRETSDKEDYLEQINKQLTKELDEKNAILTLLQENYEHLLFKYAEAQNRIDELRFKFMSESESKNDMYKGKHCRSDNQISSCFYRDECGSKGPDIKCQKAIVAPFMKIEEPVDDGTPVSRPSSLPLDNNLMTVERDLLKAATPTDSEGLSSIITSMSGHSKILNSLDEENHISKKSNYIKFQSNNFVLQENVVNDPFDKVKNWQNSLPPLEQIETPETALYNVNTTYSSSETKYKDISSPKKEFGFSDESCPDSWREEPVYCRKSSEDAVKTSHKTVSLPNTLTNRSSGLKKTYSSRCHFREESSLKNDIPSGCILQKRNKRPPLLRCSSLPAYDRESVKSGNFKNGIYIPPLDLGNVTLSDDESYCQQENYPSKSNVATSSSFVTSRGASIDRSIQTPQSFSSCKATISEENSYSRVPRQAVSKSTSITPERSGVMETFFGTKYEGSRRETPTSSRIKDCRECDNSRNWCNVCGESILENTTVEFYRNKSNSCESVHNNESSRKVSGRTKPPFKRSVSFGSESLTPKFCSHENTPEDVLSRLSQDSLENFDFYTRNLKARSQVAMRAITAHVNNCTQ